MPLNVPMMRRASSVRSASRACLLYQVFCPRGQFMIFLHHEMYSAVNQSLAIRDFPQSKLLCIEYEGCRCRFSIAMAQCAANICRPLPRVYEPHGQSPQAHIRLAFGAKETSIRANRQAFGTGRRI